MRSKIFNLDWERFDHRDTEQRKCLGGALQYFLSVPNLFTPPQFAGIQAFADARKDIRDAIAKLQEFATTADFPPSVLPIIDKIHTYPTYDNGYEQIFDVRDFSTSGRNGFTVAGVASGLTFNRVMPGEKIKVYAMAGTKGECYFDFYGGALGWHRQLFDDRDWWTIEDNAIAFRNAAYFQRAHVFYDLIEAVLNTKQCLSLTDPGCDNCDALAVADANALNTAAQTIALALMNAGYGDLASATFIVLTPLQMRGRIRRAMGENLQGFAGSEKIIDFKFQQITSLMLGNANIVYVILPKFLMKGGYRMDLTLFSDFDILSYTDTQAGWMRFGGCIGDIRQIECIDMTIPSGVPGGR